MEERHITLSQATIRALSWKYGKDGCMHLGLISRILSHRKVTDAQGHSLGEEWKTVGYRCDDCQAYVYL